MSREVSMGPVEDKTWRGGLRDRVAPSPEGICPERFAICPIHEQEVDDVSRRQGRWLPRQVSLMPGSRCFGKDAAGEKKVARENADPHSGRGKLVLLGDGA